MLRLSDLHISIVIEYAFALRLERRLLRCAVVLTSMRRPAPAVSVEQLGTDVVVVVVVVAAVYMGDPSVTLH